MKSVEDGRSDINQVAIFYEAPKTTFKNRLSGCVTHDSRSQPNPYLTSSEETELTNILQNCSSIGYKKICFEDSRDL